MAWQDAYAREGTDFGVVDGPHPNGHRGKDYKLAEGSVVPAYERCTVVDSNLYSAFLGYCVTVRLADGKYAGFAHLRKGTRPGAGTVLNPGDQIGLVAGWGDDHGKSWNGPHIHTTLSVRRDGIFNGQNLDPEPRIRAAIAAFAGGGGTTPITPRPTNPNPPKEEDMPLDNADVLKIMTGKFVNGQGKEVRIVDALSAIYFYGDVIHGAVQELIRRPSNIIDPTKLAQELVNAGLTVEAEVDVNKLAAAVDASLSDNFANLPSLSVDALRAKLND